MSKLGLPYLQGVSEKNVHFDFLYFLASKRPRKVVLYIFQQPNLVRIQKLRYFYSRNELEQAGAELCQAQWKLRLVWL